MSLFQPVFAALEEAGSRYVVVGGVATVLHGYARFTADIDVILDFEPTQTAKALAALGGLGLKPRAPVTLEAFADPAQRAAWAREKGMTVLSLWDPSDPMREVDIFVEHPIPFDDLWRDSQLMELGSAVVRVASIAHLIEMKRIANRPEDQLDIEALTAILEAKRPS